MIRFDQISEANSYKFLFFFNFFHSPLSPPPLLPTAHSHYLLSDHFSSVISLLSHGGFRLLISVSRWSTFVVGCPSLVAGLPVWVCVTGFWQVWPGFGRAVAEFWWSCG